MPDEFTERLVSSEPVVVSRRVLWGDCDPANVVYTPRFSDYLLSASDWFVRAVLDANGPALSEAGIGTPIKAMSLEFHHVLRPGEFFEMTVHVDKIRSRTFDLLVLARGADGALRFTGGITPILINMSAFTSIMLPETTRRALEAYKAANPRPLICTDVLD